MIPMIVQMKITPAVFHLFTYNLLRLDSCKRKKITIGHDITFAYGSVADKHIISGPKLWLGIINAPRIIFAMCHNVIMQYPCFFNRI